jgi:hypothetical protein
MWNNQGQPSKVLPPVSMVARRLTTPHCQKNLHLNVVTNGLQIERINHYMSHFTNSKHITFMFQTVAGA